MTRFPVLPASAWARLAGSFSYFGSARGADRWHGAARRVILRAPQDAFDCAITALVQPGQKVLVAGEDVAATRHRLLRVCGGELDVHTVETGQMTALGFDATLPYDGASFDLVCCDWGLEQAVRPHLALRELMRVLVPGQTLCFVARADLGGGGLRARLARALVRRTGRARLLGREDLTAMATDDPYGVASLTELCTGAVLGLLRKGRHQPR